MAMPPMPGPSPTPTPSPVGAVAQARDRLQAWVTAIKAVDELDEPLTQQDAVTLLDGLAEILTTDESS